MLVDGLSNGRLALAAIVARFYEEAEWSGDGPFVR